MGIRTGASAFCPQLLLEILPCTLQSQYFIFCLVRWTLLRTASARSISSAEEHVAVQHICLAPAYQTLHNGLQAPESDIQVRSRTKSKLAQLPSLQPEDSAEQLSSMVLPSRQTTARASAFAAQQLAPRTDSAPTSGLAVLQPAESDSRVAMGGVLIPTPRVSAAAPQASSKPWQQLETSSRQHSTAVNAAGSDQQGELASEPVSDGTAVAAGADMNNIREQQQQQGSYDDTAEMSMQGLQSVPTREHDRDRPASHHSAEAEALLQHTASGMRHDAQQDPVDSAGVQLAQQQSLESSQDQNAAHQLEDPLADAPPLATTMQRSKQVKRGESVYAARDLTVLEQYESDVVQAYAASFLAEAMMQGIVPAAANALAADEHARLLAEALQRNALHKAMHLVEVKAERAAWEAHEENMKR